MADDLRHRYAEALAAKFTRPRYLYDRKTDTDTVENAEPSDRVESTMAVYFTAGDGHLSFRGVTCNEAAEACAAVRDEELERLRLIAGVNHGLHRSAHEEADEWRERAETAEAAIARAHEVAASWRDDALARAAIRPATPEHAMWAAVAHVCALVLAALDDTTESDRG